ncbi:MAG: hypothetical protein Q7U16_09350 [Agitococcus sp.]|nr:hypothetical protein [Agitococcus sp.]
MQVFFSKNRLNQLGLYVVFSYAFLVIAGVVYFKSNIVIAGYLVYLVYLLSIVHLVGFCFNRRIPIRVFRYLILMFLLCLVLLLQYVFLGDAYDKYGRSSFFYVVGLVKIAVFWSFVGMLVAQASLKVSSLLSLSVILSCIFFLSAGSPAGGVLIDYQMLSSAFNVDELTHLNLEDYVVLLCIICYVLAPVNFKFIIFVFIIFALFVVGGRAALFTMALSILIFDYFSSKRKVMLIYIFLMGVLLILGVSMNVFLDFSDEYIRRILLLDGVTNDSSTQGRAEIWEESIVHLFQQFIIGDPSLIVYSFGSLGAYIHNLFSAWQFFGFFVFVFIVYLFFCFVGDMRACMTINNENKIIDFGCLLLIYTIINIVFAKYVGFYFLWLTIGYWSFLNVPKIKLFENN